MSEVPSLHLLQTCPFCWKVRGLLEHIDLEYNECQVNPMKKKKQLAFAGDWNKVPVWRDGDGEVVVDSTPIMRHIDQRYNEGVLFKAQGEELERQEKWLEWVDQKLAKATVPALYGGIGAAISTTRAVGKVERFGIISSFLYRWVGFLVMWGIIARTRVKKDGRKPQKLWHDLLDELVQEIGTADFFGGDIPNGVDLAAFGIARSMSPFRQFSFIESHTEGIEWYRRVEATL